MRPHKLDGARDADVDAAIMTVRKMAASGTVATGLRYINEYPQDLHDLPESDPRPLPSIPFTEL